MTTLGANLRTFLLAQSPITDVVGERVYQNRVPTKRAYPYVWFGRRAIEDLETCDPHAGEYRPFYQYFDIECVSDDVDQALDLGETIRGLLHDYTGQVGTENVAGIHVRDQQDDYQAKNEAADSGVTIVAFDTEFLTP